MRRWNGWKRSYKNADNILVFVNKESAFSPADYIPDDLSGRMYLFPLVIRDIEKLFTKKRPMH